VASTATPVGSVRRILTDNLESAPGKRVEIAEVGTRYREVCRAESKRIASMDDFVAEVKVFCETIGIRRLTIRDKVFLMDVMLTQSVKQAAHDR
jgi:hypothetical protein